MHDPEEDIGNSKGAQGISKANIFRKLSLHLTGISTGMGRGVSNPKTLLLEGHGYFLLCPTQC